MLILTKKQYEIEEDIILNDENNNEIYKFKMQLNADELKQLQEALIGKNTLKKAKQIGIGVFAGVSHVGEPVIGVGLVWRLW